MADALAAVSELQQLGPKIVLVTSLTTDETPADAVDVIACDKTSRYRVRTPKLSVAAHGAGDLIASLFLAHYLRSCSVADALSRAMASVFGVLKRSAARGGGEMALIEAQAELINPSENFQAEPL
jgi:pyridoxine kinase